MRSRELLIQITALITVLAAIITVVTGFRDFRDVLRDKPALIVALGTLAAMAASAYSLFAYRFLARNPIPLSISLLGFPGSGKSVYLTTLFDELQRHSLMNSNDTPAMRSALPPMGGKLLKLLLLTSTR